MSDRKEVQAMVYMRTIRLEVVIPEEHVWNFMKEFGEKFADQMEVRPREVEKFFYHPNGWHVIVIIGEFEEDKFNEFFVEFCTQKGLTFRDPREQEE